MGRVRRLQAWLTTMVLSLLLTTVALAGSASNKDPSRQAPDYRQAPAVAREEWNYFAPPGWRIFFHGVSDVGGNLYWAECGPRGLCDIVSVSSDGSLRFRVPGQQSPLRSRVERGRLVLIGDLLMESLEPGVVRALRSSDGGEAWRHVLGGELCGGSAGTSPGALQLQSITGGAPGQMFLEAHGVACGLGARRHWILSLASSTGELRWTKQFDRSPSELVADGRGAIYVRTELPGDDGWYRSFLLSFDAEGVEQWRTEASWTSRPVAVAGDSLFDSERNVWRASAGSLAFKLPWEPAWAGFRNAFTVSDGRSAFAIARQKGECPGPDCSLRLHRVDLGGSQTEWSIVLARGNRVSTSEPILTAEGTVLFAQSVGFESVLREFSSDGTEIRTEALPGGPYSGAIALVGDRWVTAMGSPASQLRAFHTVAQPARRGWMSWCGDQGCAGRPGEERAPVAARRPSRR